jgi:L,D-peptidoglycan transpeptidase YkuD (ErfK/YbiS/YcfS/YnhG family)
MIILLKNKHTLQVDNFYFKCAIGKNGLSSKKKEGDKKTPTGTFGIKHLYFRKDRIDLTNVQLKSIQITPKMGWCDDVSKPKKYNKLINITKDDHHEKLFRNDYKYDLFIPIKYNFKKRIVGKGSCIFIHLTKNYQPTAGCIALKKKDFLIMLKLINKRTKIKIY